MATKRQSSWRERFGDFLAELERLLLGTQPRPAPVPVPVRIPRDPRIRR